MEIKDHFDLKRAEYVIQSNHKLIDEIRENLLLSDHTNEQIDSILKPLENIIDDLKEKVGIYLNLLKV